MLRGNWRYIVAVAGLSLLGASNPPQPAGKGEKPYPTAKHAPLDPAATAKDRPADYEQPCDRQKRNRNSDLCAQWTAADAARDAADWTYLALWLTGASLVGLFVTLAFNYAAWKQARESKVDTNCALLAAEKNAGAAMKLAEVAETNSKKELRAYLDFNGIHLEKWPDFDGIGVDEIGMRLGVKITNYGRTPAENVESVIQQKIRVNSTASLTNMFGEDRNVISSIAPSDDFNLRFCFRVSKDIYDALDKGQLWCRACAIVTYTDVFGETHVLRGGFESRNLKDELSAVEGTRAST